MAFDMTTEARVYSASIPRLVAKTVDTVINSSPITLRLLGKQKPWRTYFPIKYAVGITGTDFDGLDKFSTALGNSFERMKFDPTGFSVNVAYSQLELDVAATGSNDINMIARELESRAEDMIDGIGTRFFTLQTGKKFLSLIDACDDETLGPDSYGGLDRSTYGLSGTYTATGGAMSMSNLRTKYNACVHGTSKPTLIVTTKARWASYEALVITTTSYGTVVYSNSGYPQMTRTGILPNVQGLKGDRGFDALWYSGVPMVVDEKCPTNYLFMLNEDHLAFYGVKSLKKGYTPVVFGQGSIDSVYSNVPKVTGFAFSGFNDPIDQYGSVGHIILIGNLIADSPRHQGIEISYTS